jgi:hypothetical protein
VKLLLDCLSKYIITQLMNLKSQYKNISIIILTTVSILISTYLWSYINFSISNIQELGRGDYIENNYNQSNEILRYLIFILLPLTTFLSLMIYFKKIKINDFFIQLKMSENIENKKNKLINYLKFLIFFFLLFEFLSLDLIPRELDLLHDGQKLSAAFKSYTNGGLWSGSFIIIGLFIEILNTRLIWEIFNHESIGLMRYAIMIYVLFCKVILIAIAYKIALFSKLNFFYKEIFFVVLSFIFISLINYNGDRFGYGNIIFRELPILLFTLIFLDFLTDKSKSAKLLIVLAPFSVLSVMLSLDRGLVYNILLILFCLFLIINKKLKYLFSLLISILFFWILTFLFLGNEFNLFWENSLYIFSDINYVHGWIHPTPFGSEAGSTRATKTLIFILLNLIISFFLFSKKMNKFPLNLKVSLLFFSTLSFLSYVYALGRTEVHHIRESFGYPVIFLSILIIYYFFRILSENNFSFIIRKKFFFFFLFPIFFLFSYLNFNINLNNILDYKNRFINYIYFDDKSFLNKKDVSFIENAKEYIIDYNCFQNFTNDIALNYLLKKPNCTKFYMVYALGSKQTQKKLIEDISKFDIVIAYKERPRAWNYKNEPNYKLWIVKNYIEKNFNVIYEEEDRLILKRNGL